MVFIKLPGRVGSGQPNSYRRQKKKNSAKFRLDATSAMAAMDMSATIFNPPHHRYSVAFFQKSATQLHHGGHLTTLAGVMQQLC